MVASIGLVVLATVVIGSIGGLGHPEPKRPVGGLNTTATFEYLNEKHLAIVPRLMPKIKNFPEAKRNAHIATVNASQGLIKEFANITLVQKVSGRTLPFILIPLIKKFIQETNNRHISTDIDGVINLPTEFNKNVRVLVSDILNGKKASSNQMGKNEKPEISSYDRLLIFGQALKALAEKSPHGLYLDWRHMTIDGELLTEYLAPVFKELNHRYSITMRTLKAALNLIDMMKKKTKVISVDNNAEPHDPDVKPRSAELEST